MSSIIDEAPCGFLTVDEAGFVRYANSTLCEIVERSRPEVEGGHVDLLLPPAGRIFYSTHLFPLLRIQGRAEELYVPVVTAAGRELPMLVNGRARADADGTAFDLVLVPMRQRNRLESELVDARNQAHEALSAKDRFLSVVSHELRSPLAAITGYAEILLRERAGPLTDRQRRYLEHIRDAGHYQAQLIADILDFAAIGKEQDLSMEVVAVEDILSRAESILSVRAQQDGRRLKRRPRPASGAVRADPRATQQVILNLGMNALKYGNARSVVGLEATLDGTRARISVADEGPGIAPDDISRIFEPFVQLGSAGASRSGVGLGLAISRDLARAMGGDLTVTSQVGLGSTFTLELPEVSEAGPDSVP